MVQDRTFTVTFLEYRLAVTDLVNLGVIAVVLARDSTRNGESTGTGLANVSTQTCARVLCPWLVANTDAVHTAPCILTPSTAFWKYF